MIQQSYTIYFIVYAIDNAAALVNIFLMPTFAGVFRLKQTDR